MERISTLEATLLAWGPREKTGRGSSRRAAAAATATAAFERATMVNFGRVVVVGCEREKEEDGGDDDDETAKQY